MRIPKLSLIIEISEKAMKTWMENKIFSFYTSKYCKVRFQRIKDVLFNRIFCEFSLFGCGCEGVRVYQCFPHLSPWSVQPRSSQHFDLISCHIIKCPQSPARWSQSRPRQMVERWQYQGITPDSTRGMGQSPHQTGDPDKILDCLPFSIFTFQQSINNLPLSSSWIWEYHKPT